MCSDCDLGGGAPVCSVMMQVGVVQCSPTHDVGTGSRGRGFLVPVFCWPLEGDCPLNPERSQGSKPAPVTQPSERSQSPGVTHTAPGMPAPPSPWGLTCLPSRGQSPPWAQHLSGLSPTWSGLEAALTAASPAGNSTFCLCLHCILGHPLWPGQCSGWVCAPDQMQQRALQAPLVTSNQAPSSATGQHPRPLPCEGSKGGSILFVKS